jgi:hypothetical protein
MTNEERIEIFEMPFELQYNTIEKFDNGGVLFEHLIADMNEDDFDELKIIAYQFAIMGHIVYIQPIVRVGVESKNYRDMIFSGLISKGNKNPDLRIDNFYADLKRCKYKNIGKNMNDAAEQGAIAIISDKKILFEEGAVKKVKSKLSTNKYPYSFAYLYEKGEII